MHQRAYQKSFNKQIVNPRYAYIGPTYKQTKSIIFDYLKHYAGVIPGIKFNEQELSCTFPNGAKITYLDQKIQTHFVVITSMASLQMSMPRSIQDCFLRLFVQLIRSKRGFTYGVHHKACPMIFAPSTSTHYKTMPGIQR